MSHFWLIFCPTTKSSFTPESFNQLNTWKFRPRFPRWIFHHFQVKPFVHPKGGLESKVWSRWSLPFFGGRISGSKCPCPFFPCQIFFLVCRHVGVSMLLIFRKRFVSPRIFTKKKTFEKKNLELPGALQAPSRPLRPANRSLVFTGRGASPKKFGRWFFFGGHGKQQHPVGISRKKRTIWIRNIFMIAFVLM